MNNEPKSIWKKSWRGPRAFFLFWFLILTFAAFVALLCFGTINKSRFSDSLLFVLFWAVIVGLAGFLMVAFIRSLFSWRGLKRALLGFLCLVTLLALFYAEENVRGKWAWEKFEREWNAKGETFDWHAVVPPPVPEDQNFALTPVVASSYEMLFDRNGREIQPRNTNVVDRLSMSLWRYNPSAKEPRLGGWRVARKTDLEAWQSYFRVSPHTNSHEATATNSFPLPAQPQSPAEDVLQALSRFESNIEELRQASRLPYSRFPLTYDKANPAEILLPHLAALKSCGEGLTLRSLAELQLNQTGEALADVMLGMRLVDSIRTEPILISQLVRIRMINIALQPVWEGLAEHKWSEAQLTELGEQLMTLDFAEDGKRAMRGEMALQTGVIEFLRRHPQRMEVLGQLNNSGRSGLAEGRWVSQFIPAGWFYQGQLRCARFMVQYHLPLMDAERGIISPEMAKRANTAFEAEMQDRNPYNLLARVFLPALANVGEEFAQAQSTVDLARLACALERHRLAHNEYPETLDALVPQFLGKLPHDIITGQPLHYRRQNDGRFLLYSVGWNQKDDGGTIVRKNDSTSEDDPDQGDWVWPTPAL